MKIHQRTALLASAAVAVWVAPATAQNTQSTNPPPASSGVGATQLSTPAPAADPVTPTETTSVNEANDAVQGDIIVTAQRRDELLSRTPVAVSVVSADTLARANITTESDLPVAAPGLQVRLGQNSNQLNYAIRGQSLDAYSNTRPGVQPYINEVQIGGVGASSGFFDLQSVQVLKGPQGTLFGRNSTGGAVLFTTQQPTNEFGGYVSGTVGNYDLRKLEGAINAPLVGETLLARVSGFYQKRDGFQYNINSGSRTGGYERYGVRGSLTAVLGSVTNRFVIDYQHTDGSNLASVIGSIDTTIPGSFPTVALYNPPGAVSDFVLSQILQAGGVPPATATALATGNFDRYIARFPRYTGLNDFFAQQQARGPYRIDINSANNYFSRNTFISNTTTLDLDENTQLKNIFGYVHLKSLSNVEADGTIFSIADEGSDPSVGSFDKSIQYQEELQLLGTAGALKYVAGFYYAKETLRHRMHSEFFDIIFAPTIQINNNSKINTTYAGYAQGTYDLSDATGLAGLGITAGVRYNIEKARVTTDDGDFARTAFGPTPPPGFSYDQSRKFKNLSWTLGLQEQVNSNLLIYAASRRSYKNGGFNGQLAPRIGFADSLPAPGNGYRTERVTDAEIGLKYSGRIGYVPTRFTLAGYSNWIQNSQRTAFVSVGGNPTAITINIPKARVTGFEAEGQFTPVRWLTLGAAANYTDGRFTDNRTIVAGTPGVYDTYPDTPKWSGNVFADVTVPLAGSVTGLLHGDVYSQSKVFYTSHGNVNTTAFTPHYTLANFRAGLQDGEAGWSLTANLKNVFNKVYYVGGLANAELFQLNTIIPGEPRTFTVEARFKF
jgi:iron complex outermembrane recepter protein